MFAKVYMKNGDIALFEATAYVNAYEKGVTLYNGDTKVTELTPSSGFTPVSIFFMNSDGRTIDRIFYNDSPPDTPPPSDPSLTGETQ